MESEIETDCEREGKTARWNLLTFPETRPCVMDIPATVCGKPSIFIPISIQITDRNFQSTSVEIAGIEFGC